jgi:hypothetical protein
MNTDYVIQIRNKSGRTWRYRTEKNGWTQTASTGIVRQCSGDQLLLHLSPPLAGDQPGLSVRVKRRQQRRKRSTSNAQQLALSGGRMGPTLNGKTSKSS